METPTVTLSTAHQASTVLRGKPPNAQPTQCIATGKVILSGVIITYKLVLYLLTVCLYVALVTSTANARSKTPVLKSARVYIQKVLVNEKGDVVSMEMSVRDTILKRSKEYAPEATNSDQVSSSKKEESEESLITEALNHEGLIFIIEALMVLLLNFLRKKFVILFKKFKILLKRLLFILHSKI